MKVFENWVEWYSAGFLSMGLFSLLYFSYKNDIKHAMGISLPMLFLSVYSLILSIKIRWEDKNGE